MSLTPASLSLADEPLYTLYQRDRGDAPDPMSLLYYDPQVSGQFWDGLALDRHFDNTTDGWFSARSSWTDNDGAYIAMKAGYLQGHQTHGDLDAGTFVLDAMGHRWAGELGSGCVDRFSRPRSLDPHPLAPVLTHLSLLLPPLQRLPLAGLLLERGAELAALALLPQGASCASPRPARTSSRSDLVRLC